MNLTRLHGFEGWYFNHQKNGDSISFIPGHTGDTAFIQVIANSCSRQYDVPELTIVNGVIHAGNSTFSRKGCKIDLPGVKGQVRYQGLTPLKSDIMGPFQYLPMQCRHGVISMHHHLQGSIILDGIRHNFNDGKGYIELDSGISFPRSYLWMQCNDFRIPCSIMISLAHIPICGYGFTGCICALIYKGHEYRFATYHGVRIVVYQENHICLLQGRYFLEVDLLPCSEGYPLSSPVKGKMSGTIRESNNARVRVRFYHNGKQIFDLSSNHALYEFVP